MACSERIMNLIGYHDEKVGSRKEFGWDYHA